jgi:hypothetical protein
MAQVWQVTVKGLEYPGGDYEERRVFNVTASTLDVASRHTKRLMRKESREGRRLYSWRIESIYRLCDLDV